MTVDYRMTGEQLTAFQQRLERHMAFSLTEACPFRCAHCIVSTVSPRDAVRFTLPAAQARRFAGEMAQLRSRGIDRISFTGGEPLLAPVVLGILSEGAAAAGIACTVVTACHWAATTGAARRTLRRYPHIHHWHLSADTFHQAFLPLASVVRAATVALQEGRSVVVRMAVRWPSSQQDREFYERLAAALPDGVQIAVQQVNVSGRAEQLGILPAATGNRRRCSPCMSTGLVVRHDGSVSPCCSSLIDQRQGHPFQYPAATAVGLAETYDGWRSDALLQLIRSIGFDPVLEWVRQASPEHPALLRTPDHPCELCQALWRVPGTADTVRQYVEKPVIKEKIVELYQAVLGAPQPL